LNTACITPTELGMPVLKNTAITTREARPHNSSSTISTPTNSAMLRKWLRQQVAEAARLGIRPNSRRRLTSYKPMARNGPTSRQPEAIVMVNSGLLRNTTPRISAMAQNAAP
jgi:hypothetical protein